GPNRNVGVGVVVGGNQPSAALRIGELEAAHRDVDTVRRSRAVANRISAAHGDVPFGSTIRSVATDRVVGFLRETGLVRRGAGSSHHSVGAGRNRGLERVVEEVANVPVLTVGARLTGRSLRTLRADQARQPLLFGAFEPVLHRNLVGGGTLRARLTLGTLLTLRALLTRG